MALQRDLVIHATKAENTAPETSHMNPKAGHAQNPNKALTSIEGFDEITNGGLPRGCTTLLSGGAGSGKTIFALQFLVGGASAYHEPGIFVAFEESSERLASNAEIFGWKIAKLRRLNKLFFLDAQPKSDLIQSGTFDLGGMLAALGAQSKAMGARRIVFDALDIVVALMPDAVTKRREIYRLHEWLLANKLTGIITSKLGGDGESPSIPEPIGFMPFMVDCAVVLNHRVEVGVSQRSLRVTKFRGSGFDEDECPLVIGKEGFDVAISRMPTRGSTVTSERLTSGVKRLDTMLGGGYYRGACVLITGLPGTAKTTLGGAFAEAACARGERTMVVGFDSDAAEVIRNLASVQIQLNRYVRTGKLRMVSARSIAGSAETLLVRIKALAKQHRAQCVVIDPVSTLSRAGNELTAHNVTERLIDWSKAAGITLVCTSLINELNGQTEDGQRMHISTLADTWIHLSYLVQSGERNRGLSIIKSRGMAHSNQVRELLLTESGVTLADIYTASGEVLMGTLRWERERSDRVAGEVSELATKHKRVSLDAEEAVLKVRLKSLQTELAAKGAEKALLLRTMGNRKGEISRGRLRMRQLRGADSAKRAQKQTSP